MSGTSGPAQALPVQEMRRRVGSHALPLASALARL